MRLGAPHPEQICVELLRHRGKAQMKVEVFKRQDKKYTDKFAMTKHTGKLEMIKDSPFSKVGEEYVSCLKSCSL